MSHIYSESMSFKKYKIARNTPTYLKETMHSSNKDRLLPVEALSKKKYSISP